MSRIKIELPEKMTFTYSIPVRVTDLNYGGHVGNDVFLSMIHEGRVRYLQSLGYQNELDVAGVGLIMADVGIQYLGELFLNDTVDVKVGVSNVSRRSFDLCYEISRASDGGVVGKAKTGMVCFDYAARKSVSIPDALIKAWDEVL